MGHGRDENGAGLPPGVDAPAPPRDTALVDVLIQTHNEELNLPHTLASVRGWVNKVFVVDSGSTDRTQQIAADFGAEFVYHAWEGYAAQKNWALDNLPFERPWILILDADEAVSGELKQEICSIVNKPVESVHEAGFYLNRVFIFGGRQIRHCGYFPSWNLRLFKRGKARYEERLVHEHMVVDGPTAYCKHLLIHEDRRGLEHFFAKHNRYSTLEAREIYESPEPWPGLGKLLGDRVARRRFVKSRILPYLPLPWTWRLFYMYFWRLGFLDGRAGWTLSNFISTYEFLIQSKYQELRRLRGKLAFSRSGLAEPEGRLTREVETGMGAAARESDSRVAKAEPRAEANGHAAPAAESKPASRQHRTTPVVIVPATEPSRGETVVAGRTDRDPAKVPISVMIPTLNEAKNLPRCLDHLQWADEVVVVDSGSSDDTVKIAGAYGAKVVNFKWNGRWPKKKNWALRHAPMRNQWVLIVDADEWITPELAAEITAAIKDPARVGYYINRKFIFMGRWIKHCGYYPSWNLRLIKRGYGEYEQLTDMGDTGSGDNEVHEHVIARGDVGYLNEDMLHFAFPNIHTFMEKHNRYSNWEAAVQFKKVDSLSAAIGSELSKRRRLKNLSRVLPFRPSLRFLYSYIWKGGWLDGQPGYVFCRLLAIYEYLSVAKYIELKRADADQRNARSLSAVPAMQWDRMLPPNQPSADEAKSPPDPVEAGR
jgi:glycosyltransferase involved in cell wall biosynthesis